jgi:hypothetical protein
MAESLMEEDVTDIVTAVVKAAKKGSLPAARLILDRIAPVRRGRPLQLELPEAETAEGVSAAVAKLIGLMSEGEVSPDEAATIAGVLEIRRRVIEMQNIDRRLSALEGKGPDRQGARTRLEMLEEREAAAEVKRRTFNPVGVGTITVAILAWHVGRWVEKESPTLACARTLGVTQEELTRAFTEETAIEGADIWAAAIKSSPSWLLNAAGDLTTI